MMSVSGNIRRFMYLSVHRRLICKRSGRPSHRGRDFSNEVLPMNLMQWSHMVTKGHADDVYARNRKPHDFLGAPPPFARPRIRLYGCILDVYVLPYYYIIRLWMGRLCLVWAFYGIMRLHSSKGCSTKVLHQQDQLGTGTACSLE